MPDDKMFTVPKLLTDYKKRVAKKNSEIVFLRNYPTVRDKIVEDLNILRGKDYFPKKEKKLKELNWHEVHKIVERLWQNLVSCAINSIDPN